MINSIYITSEIDGLLYHSGKFIQEVQANSLPIIYTPKIKEILFSFYPIDDNIDNQSIKLIPYSAHLTINGNEIECKNQNITLIKYPMNDYDLIFKSNYIEIGNKQTIFKSIKINNEIIKFEYNSFFQNNLIFSLNNNQFNFYSKYHIENIKLTKYIIDKNIYILLTARVQQYDYMSIFYYENNRITRLGEFLANKIEIKDNLFSTLIQLNNMAKHVVITKFKLQNNNIIKLEKYLSAQNDLKTFKNTTLIPYAFLEAIQCKDYALSKTYLSKALNESLSENHLKKFFNNIIDIKQPHNEKENCVAIIYNENNKFIAKYCEFTFLDDKIDNINFL